jgi:hypothetical protein
MAAAPIIVESEPPLITAQKQQLRVGVLLDSLLVPNWAYHILEELQRTEEVKLIVIVTGDNPSAIAGPQDERAPKLIRYWCNLDENLFCRRSAHHDAFASRTFTPTNGVQVTSYPAQAGRHDWTEESAAELHSMQLDVLLNLSSKGPTRESQAIAKHGLLWFGNQQDLMADLFWLLYERHPVIENTLNISSNEFGTATLVGCYSAADKYSLFRNLTEACWRRWGPVQQWLNQIRSDGNGTDCNGLVTLAASSHTRPGNRECARLLVRLLARMVRHESLQFFRQEEWFIAFRKIHAANADGSQGKFTLLRPPSGHLYADPFVIERNGKTYIFFEDFSHATGKAVISFISIDAEGEYSAPEVALEEDYHLSYPHLFELDGMTYLLPESKNHRTIQLYQALDFPNKWSVSHVLQEDVSAVDSTLVQHQEKFWLFTSGLRSQAAWFDGDSELFLFFADCLQGPWRPHPRNPIVLDVRNCRGAGRIQRCNGQLIRPAQDCSSVYGRAVVLNHIDVLSENDYRETPIAMISPDWLDGNIGTHTYNCSKSYEVLDGRVPVGRFWNGRRSPQFQAATPLKALFKSL